MKKQLSIVIPSRPQIDNIYAILGCLGRQTLQNFKVFLVIDSHLDKSAYQELSYTIGKFLEQKQYTFPYTIVSNISHDFVPKKNASATRNFGIQMCDTSYLYLFDDDNMFDEDHIEKTFSIYQELEQYQKSDFILTGTLWYRKTGIIQNQGFKKYNYWMSRPSLNFLGDKEWDTICMYSGNGLFGPTYIFQEILYDEHIDFVAEDLDFTYRISKKYPLIVHRDLPIYHMEREKSYLEHVWVGNEFGAYRKGKHRVIFMKKHANLWEKFQFYVLGLWGNSLWLSTKIVFLGGEQRWKILKSFYKGTWDGIKN